MKSIFVDQKITALANQYRVYETTADGAKGELVAFAAQKRLALKEKIEFFKDEKRSEPIFSVRAEQMLDTHGKFLVSDTANKPIGATRKIFKSSLLRSTWQILDKHDKPAVIIRERSKTIAILRRLWAFVPIVGDFPFLMRYNFDFIEPEGSKLVARYVKKKIFYDHYHLEVADDSFDIDWRTLAAQCVLLDALQSR